MSNSFVERRLAMKLSQAEIADEIHVSKRTIKRWEAEPEMPEQAEILLTELEARYEEIPFAKKYGRKLGAGRPAKETSPSTTAMLAHDDGHEMTRLEIKALRNAYVWSHTKRQQYAERIYCWYWVDAEGNAWINGMAEVKCRVSPPPLPAWLMARLTPFQLTYLQQTGRYGADGTPNGRKGPAAGNPWDNPLLPTLPDLPAA